MASDPADQEFQEAVAAILGRPLTAPERERIRKYLDMLTEWDSVHRLVGSTERRWLLANVVLDSLLFLYALPAHTTDVADLGSGAGVPGVPIALVRSDLCVTLIESRRKRASFLAAILRELPIENGRLVAARAESVPALREAFDAVVTRCAGNIDAVIDAALPLLRPGGVAVVAGPPADALAIEPPRDGRWVIVPKGRHLPVRRFLVCQRRPT
jgi:16S rRNA (guanine527-N7)-methyltransferase